jgi:pimeloyl-ACP methyl ester carboxylesterase
MMRRTRTRGDAVFDTTSQPKARSLQFRWILQGMPAVMAALFMVGCGAPKPTRVLLVGGAGLSQLGDLGETISAMCPNAEVVETGGWDGFRANLEKMARDRPEQGVILIGHSFGCQTIAQAAAELAPVDLVVMIDPAWDDITLPPGVRSCMWYQRAEDGLERRAVIRNGGRPTLVSGDHAGICHSGQLIAEVSRVVRDISDRRAMQLRMRGMFQR